MCREPSSPPWSRRVGGVWSTYRRRPAESALLETIAGQLFSAGMFEKAGNFFEKLDDPRRAMDCYRKGQAYGRAVDLSRRCFQGRDVVELELQWGDYLVECRFNF